MTKSRIGFWLCLMVATVAHASNIALVYENEAAVKQGKATIGTVVSDGVLTSAQFALSASKTILIAPAGQDLRRGVLVRLDNDLDLAVLRLGDLVTDPILQEANRKKSEAVLAFAPAGVAAANADGTTSSLLPVEPLKGEGWVLKINDQVPGREPIELKSALSKSQFKVELVYMSTTPVWGFSFKLMSSPKLSFWKQGRQTTLNEVPKPIFIYDHQALFSPLKGGKSVVLPMEAHFIDEKKEYNLTFEITSKKAEKFSQTVRVIFK